MTTESATYAADRAASTPEDRILADIAKAAERIRHLETSVRRWKAAARIEWRAARAACALLDDACDALTVYGVPVEPAADGVHDLVRRLACEADAWRDTAITLAPAIAEAQYAALFGGEVMR